jgi:predicted ATPase/class 3 adenylate cyclase
VTVLTFLFTDLVDSTRLWEVFPEAMQPALARHDALLRQVIAEHQGQLIKSTGDGCHAAFESAAQAVAAVLVAQQALWAEPWPALPPGALRVRMALHTGDAEGRAGDYFGPAVNRAARLMAIAHGGQILLSAATAELVRDQLPLAAVLLDLGVHRLKDLARPEHVFQLAGPGLAGHFPPLRSLDVQPNNLPAPVTSFIGREAELAEVRRLLASARLLTLTGPGGTGKTRLALQAAAEGLDLFPHGVWLVELAPLADPGLLPQAVAASLELRELPGRALLEALQDYLRPKTALLLLDNCEHLIEASAGLAARLLPACPQLKLLATSREALGVPGETHYRVPSLSLADSTHDLASSEAVRLFVERAQAARPGFALTSQNQNFVAQICRRLDGIPLAIELAAARVKLLTPEQIAARLDDRFRLLTGGSRTALPRQQTLRALIDWSCELLTEAERAAWRQLSVFAGGWTVEAAEAIIGPDALDRLALLVDKSIVAANPNPDTGETRYHLLETMRQYGRDRLLEAGEAEMARDRHLACYRRLAAEAEPRLTGPDLVAVLNQLDAELDNLRAALEWALARDPKAALDLATNLKYFWVRRGYHAEGRRWLAASLVAHESESPGVDSGLRARARQAEGFVAFGQGQLPAARAALEAGVELARQAGDTATLGLTLGMVAQTALWLGDDTRAQAALDEGLGLPGIEDNLQARFTLLAVQAQQAGQQGDVAAAQAHMETAVQLVRQSKDPWLAAMFRLAMGGMASSQDRFDQAQAHFAEAEHLFRALGDRHMANAMRSEQAHVARRRGHFQDAAALYAQTIPTWQDLGSQPAGLLHELECLGYIALALEQPQRAARLLGAAERQRQERNAPMTAVELVEHDEQLAALRAQLDPAALAAAWTEGRSFSLDGAVAYALTDTWHTL